MAKFSDKRIATYKQFLVNNAGQIEMWKGKLAEHKRGIIKAEQTVAALEKSRQDTLLDLKEAGVDLEGVDASAAIHMEPKVEALLPDVGEEYLEDLKKSNQSRKNRSFLDKAVEESQPAFEQAVQFAIAEVEKKDTRPTMEEATEAVAAFSKEAAPFSLPDIVIHHKDGDIKFHDGDVKFNQSYAEKHPWDSLTPEQQKTRSRLGVGRTWKRHPPQLQEAGEIDGTGNS